jgi:predicted glycoside hydrolase/deacetylase ChbG (UPF0249 family)
MSSLSQSSAAGKMGGEFKTSGPPRRKTLIIHGDDLGLSRSVNQATFRALEEGVITSASAMVPTPWFAEVVKFSQDHPQVDLGLHITLTSEWRHYRWTPVLAPGEVRSLIDEHGYFHRDVVSLMKSLRLEEMKCEIRAQIETALRAGIRPTHIDSHMHAAAFNAEIYAAFSEVAQEYSLPHIHVSYQPKSHSSRARWQEIAGTNPALLQMMPGADPSQWEIHYCELLRSVVRDLTQLTVHLGFDDSELRRMTVDRASWNAVWRYRDYQAVNSRTFRKRIEDLEITLADWRSISQPELEGVSALPIHAASHTGRPAILKSWTSGKSPSL